mmetsp:Transcript_10734/g.34143  ORF Transcript_10734/g.34143 Transcript_10734/m.34143 type:complete len:215 (+) Transcript_10734:704-1348(+)
MKPLVPSIGSSTQQRSPVPRGGSSPRSTEARKAASSGSPPYCDESRSARLRSAASSRKSPASSSPMKRSAGKARPSSCEMRPWMAKSAAVTGVESPALMKETPAVTSHSSISLPLASESTTRMSQASAWQSCIARWTHRTAMRASAARSPPQSGPPAAGLPASAPSSVAQTKPGGGAASTRRALLARPTAHCREAEVACMSAAVADARAKASDM